MLFRRNTMTRYFLVLLTTLLLVSCNNKTKDQQTQRYHDDGRAKPIVTVVPIIDSSSYEIPWSISDEFTLLVKDRLLKQGDLYLQNNENFHQGICSTCNRCINGHLHQLHQLWRQSHCE